MNDCLRAASRSTSTSAPGRQSPDDVRWRLATARDLGCVETCVFTHIWTHPRVQDDASVILP